MLKLVLIALEILKQIQQSRGTIKVSLTYQSQCSSITYQDALNAYFVVRWGSEIKSNYKFNGNKFALFHSYLVFTRRPPTASRLVKTSNS